MPTGGDRYPFHSPLPHSQWSGGRFCAQANRAGKFQSHEAASGDVGAGYGGLLTPRVRAGVPGLKIDSAGSGYVYLGEQINDSSGPLIWMWVWMDNANESAMFGRGFDGHGAGWSIAMSQSAAQVVLISGGAAAITVYSDPLKVRYGRWYHMALHIAHGVGLYYFQDGEFTAFTATTKNTLRSSTQGCYLGAAYAVGFYGNAIYGQVGILDNSSGYSVPLLNQTVRNIYLTTSRDHQPRRVWSFPSTGPSKPVLFHSHYLSQGMR